MPSYVIIAIACAVAVGQAPGVAPLEQSPIRVLLTLGATLVSCLMARITVAACSDTADTLSLSGLCASRPLMAKVRTRENKYRQRWERLHLFVWLGMTAFLLFGLGWGTIVRINWQLSSSLLLDEIIILLPLVVPWIITWIYAYELEFSNSTSDDSPQRTTFLIKDRIRFAMQRAKTVFGLGLVPVLAVCLISDATKRVYPEYIDHPIPPRMFLVPMALIFLGYPILLRKIWTTTPLPPGEFHDALTRFAASARMRLNQVYVWHTDGQMLNAAVTGLIPRIRFLFFTDRLLDELPSAEILATMAHEFGHVRHRHLLLRIIALFFPMTLLVTLSALVAGFPPPPSAVSAVNGNLNLATESGLHPHSEWIAVAMVLVSVLYLWKVIGAYSRSLEYEADETGWRMLSDHVGCKKSATNTYTSMLQRIGGNENAGGGWLHPPIAERIARIRYVADRAPSVGTQRFALRIIAAVLYIVTFAATLILMLGNGSVPAP